MLSTQVQSYQVEWDTNPGVAEVQTVTTSTYLGANELQTIRTFGKDVDEIQLVRTLARPHREEQWVTATAPAGSTLAGTFALALDTRPTGGTLQYTGAIPASAAACCGRTSVLAMVEALQNVGLGMVTKVKREDVSIDGRAGFQWQIQFNETLADLPQLQVLDASGLTLGSTVTVATETEGNAISGTFRLTFGGDTTALIAADATAGEVEDALELLDTVTDVTVVRGDAQPFGGFSWWVTFVHDDQGGDQPLLTPVYEGTLLGLSGDPWVETSEVRAGNTLSGSFNVTFHGEDGPPVLEYVKEPYPQSQSFTTVDESGTFTDSDTTLSVAAAADLTGLAANSYIRVGSEIMLVTAIASDDLTVTRGQSGTAAAAHADGAVVDLLTQSTVATSDITAVATTVNVALNTGGLGAAAKSYIRIGKEVMLVSSISTNALTVVRAQDGTTAATHAIGATVYLLRESTLDGALTVLTTTVNVDLNTAGLGAAVNDYILIGSEVMLVTKVATNTLTVTRAQDGTAATTHADAAKVYLLQSSTQQVKATYALPQPESTIATGNEADNGNAVGITTIDVTLNTAALDAAVNSYIQIGSEVMLVTGVNTNELTVTRGTSPAVHADGAKVYRLAQTTIATGNAADNGATTTAIERKVYETSVA
jgi:hypothetical protein